MRNLGFGFSQCRAYASIMYTVASRQDDVKLTHAREMYVRESEPGNGAQARTAAVVLPSGVPFSLVVVLISLLLLFSCAPQPRLFFVYNVRRGSCGRWESVYSAQSHLSFSLLFFFFFFTFILFISWYRRSKRKWFSSVYARGAGGNVRHEEGNGTKS